MSRITYMNESVYWKGDKDSYVFMVIRNVRGRDDFDATPAGVGDEIVLKGEDLKSVEYLAVIDTDENVKNDRARAILYRIVGEKAVLVRDTTRANILKALNKSIDSLMKNKS